MKKLTSILLSVVIVFTAIPAFAATFQASNDDTFSISIPVRDDLYAAGGMVQVKEDVEGDLVIAGGEVSVIGDVEEDLIGAAGRFLVEGSVGDDVRIGGGDITLRGSIADDLIVAGGTVRIGQDVVINGDAIVIGGMLIMDGTVKGKLTMAGGEALFGGRVEGDADVKVDNLQMNGAIFGNAKIVTNSVKVLDNASIGGNLEYWTSESDPYSGIVDGETALNPGLRKSKEDVVKTTFIGATKIALLAIFGFALLSSALFILIMVLITNKYFKEAGKKVIDYPWKCMLYGLLYFVLMPVIALLFLITVIGFPISLLLFISYGFAIFFAKPLTALVLTRWAEIYYKKKWGKVKIFFVSVGLYLILKLLGLVPVVGWIIILALVFIAFGALVETKFEKWKKIA